MKISQTTNDFVMSYAHTGHNQPIFVAMVITAFLTKVRWPRHFLPRKETSKHERLSLFAPNKS